MAKRILCLCIFLFAGHYCEAAGSQLLFGFSPSDRLTQKPSISLGFGSDEWLFSVGTILNSEYTDDDFVDTPIGHNDYQDLGERRIGTTKGFDVARSFRINDSLFSVVVGAGMYFGSKAHLVKSNASGLVFAQSKRNTTDLGLETGVFVGQPEHLQIGIIYHTLRGIGLCLRIGL